MARSASSDRGIRGFSLIEVLVAVSILAVLASTVVFQSGSFGASLFRLEEKTVALWVAQNALDAERLATQLQPADSQSETVEMGGRSWVVRRTVAPTSRPGFLRIQVDVGQEDTEGTAVSLTGFVVERR